MTLPRLEAICDHWLRVPPMAISASHIAQSLGASKAPAKAKKSEKAKELNDASARQELFDMLGGSGFKLTEKPEWQRATTK